MLIHRIFFNNISKKGNYKNLIKFEKSIKHVQANLINMKKSDISIKLDLEQYIEQKQKKISLMRKAFIHKSYKDTLPHHETNETLEIVGDKVLDLVLYKHLYNLFEGKIMKWEMDRKRQEITSAEGLAPVFDYYNLIRYVKLPNPKQPINNALKHNIVESLAGAIFLIEGYPKAEKLLKKFIFNPIILF